MDCIVCEYEAFRLGDFEHICRLIEDKNGYPKVIPHKYFGFGAPTWCPCKNGEKQTYTETEKSK